MDIIIFGAGKYYENRKWSFQNYHIIAFLDNNPDLWKKKKNGVQILPPQKIQELVYDAVIVMSKSAAEMQRQLVDLGVSEEKIYHFYELSLLTEYDEVMLYYSGNLWLNHEKTQILLLTHELSLSGGPMVVLEFGRLLKSMGYMPVIASLADGKLKETILAEGIPVVVCGNISKYNKILWDWIDQFPLIIANTIAFFYFMNQSSGTNRKIIWWLHDIFDKNAAENSFPLKELTSNISIYTGGRLVKDSFYRNYGLKNMKIFLYGIPDQKPLYYRERKYCIGQKVIFAVIASVEPRKGQDIFIQAIQNLTEEERGQAEFWMIGKARNEWLQKFSDELKLLSEPIAEIKWIGEVDNQELMRLYQEIDVVVCPSRNDPMPVVVTNGFMFHKVCIVSDMTGQCDFIQNGINGFVCKTEDHLDLCNKMKWILKNPERMEEIGNCARQIYERVLSMDVFQKNAERIIRDKLESD